jgi:predicted RND superfamily exporter protein
MGLVMKNGILLVDYINTLRTRGRGLFEAVLEAGPVRLRPVLMTAVSTILGMLPVALGSGDGSEWRRPMGVISIGGLVTSTFLTLLVVPIFYTFVAQADDVLASAARRVLAALGPERARARRRRFFRRRLRHAAPRDRTRPRLPDHARAPWTPGTRCAKATAREESAGSSAGRESPLPRAAAESGKSL